MVDDFAQTRVFAAAVRRRVRTMGIRDPSLSTQARISRNDKWSPKIVALDGHDHG